MPQFNGNNDLKARQLMINRSVYNGYVLTLLDKVDEPTLETLQIKDFQKDEKMLFGRIDHPVRNAIFPVSSYLKTFPYGARGDGTQALNFVVDAFTDMKNKFDRALRIGYISPDSQALSELTVLNAYTSPLNEYDTYIEGTRRHFMKYAKDSNRIKDIADFDSFIPVFMDYVSLTANILPITRSMFFLSRYVSPRVSGMVLEIYDGDYGDDRLKTNLFYRDRNFEYLKNLAYSFGFMIDKHIPWRLIADLNSPRMTPYIKNSIGGTNPNAAVVLDVAYAKTYPDDIPSIIGLLVESYNMIVQHRPVTVIKEPAATASPNSAKAVFTNCKKVKTINRRPITIGQAGEQYDPTFWLGLYAKIRNIETNLHYTEAVLQEIINRSTDLTNSLDSTVGLGYIVSKFDNIEHFEGSLFHDVTRLEMSEDPSATEASVTETVRRSVQASNFVVY
jgi:hypothetical protein